MELYNELVKPEIEPENYLDGNLFRKESVNVFSETDKIIHSGVMPESTLIEYMQELIKIINSEDLPCIIKSAVVQYFIGYIHPFYDGNGRMSRFIGSQILSQSLSHLVSIRLSYLIKGNINKYYKAFMDCNNKKNKGDITPFIMFVLNMIYDSTEDISKSLNEKLEKMIYYFDKTTEFTFEGSNQELCHEVLRVFIQNALFSSKKLDLQTIMAATNKSYNTVKTIINQLIEQNIPIVVGKNGNKHLFKLEVEKF